MKRLFLALVVLSLIIAACGSSDAGEPPAVAEASLIETKVASTVAAALGDDAANATADIAPTAPAISGDATPLTPIPQLNAPRAEVSPEVEYAEEGRQDGQLTFDFGGGATAELQATATIAPTSTSVPESSAAIGGTVFASDEGGNPPMAYTLVSAELVNSVTDEFDTVIEPREGYGLLVVEIQTRNADVIPVETQGLLNRATYLPTFVMDRDDDTFSCSPVRDRMQRIGLLPPGYGVDYRMSCEIPVTANAEGLNGLRLVNGGYNYPTNNFEFDLGQHAMDAIDLSYLTEVMPRHTLPLSLAELCGEEITVPYVIESAVWYDRPAATPDDRTISIVAQRFESFFIPNGSPRPETPERAVELLTEYWQSIWTHYDFEAFDLVAIPITFENLTKGDLQVGVANDQFALVDTDVFIPAQHVGLLEWTDRLITPFSFMDGTLPPGVAHQSMLYALVPETDDRVTLLYQMACTSGNWPSWYMLEAPRTAFAGAGEPLTGDITAGASIENALLTISATRPRTMSDVVLEAGQQVTIRHIDGQWQPGPSPNWPPVGPQGDSRIPEKATFPKPDAPLMALAFGVEGSATVFVFEENPTTFLAPAAGRLWFGPNDDGFDDNAGELVISISLE